MKQGVVSVVAALALALVGVQAAQSASVIIDDFNDGSQTVTQTGVGTSAISSVATASAIGGSREIAVEVTAVGVPGTATARADTSPFDDLYNLDVGSAVDGIGSTWWDGSADGLHTLTLGSVDLTDGGANDRFRYIVPALDIALRVTLTICQDMDADGLEDAGECFADIFMKPSTVDDTGFFDHFFTDYLANSGAPAGLLSDVDAIHLIIEAQDKSLRELGIDLQLDQFLTTTAIPEPSTLMLMGAGLAGLALVSRIRRRQKP